MCIRDSTEREELFMSRMQSKQDFSKNPRFTKQVQQAAAREGFATVKGVMSATDTLPFGVSPAVVSFEDYTVGGVYFADVIITSSASISCRLRSLPPSRSEFSVTPLQFPMSDNGQLAPGMSCHCKVIFAPVHLAQLQDSFSIATQLGVIHINLLGKRPAPQLVIPRTLDLGPCVVGSQVSSTVTVQNSGGAGRFIAMCTKECLVLEQAPELMLQQHPWLDSPEEQPPPEQPLTTSAFSVQSAGFQLGPDQSCELTVTFAPEAHGEMQDQCYLLCDDCSYTALHFKGVGSAPVVAVTRIDEQHVAPPLPAELEFGQLCVSCVKERVVSVSNSSELEVCFSWGLFKAQDPQPDCTDLPGISSTWVAGPLQPAGQGFCVEPAQGRIAAHSTMQLCVRYAPEQQGQHNTLARMLVTEPLSGLEQSAAEFTLNGQAVLCEVEVSPPVVFFSGSLLMGMHYTRSFAMHNHSDAPTSFHWSLPPGDGESTVLISPQTGSLEPHSSQQFSMVLSSASPQPSLQISRECSLGQAEPVVVFAEAQVHSPEIRILEPSIEYGLVALDQRTSYNITLCNSSESPAEWLLSHEHTGQQKEFFFVPAHGCIAPMSSDVVTVCFKPGTLGAYQGWVALHGEGENTQYLQCSAMVQSPKVCLGSSSLQLGTAYLGVQQQHSITVRNLSMLSTHVSWQAVQAEGMIVQFEPCSCELGPAEERQMNLLFEPTRSGPLTCLLMCAVEGQAMPLGLQVSTTVATLQVEYSIAEQPPEQQGSIHFGQQVPIFSAPTRTLLITNKSAIPARFALTMQRFLAAGDSPAPPAPAQRTSLGQALAQALGPAERTAAQGSSHETARFRSEHGRSLVAARIRHAQEQSALSQDRGIAVMLSSQAGMVGAWETVTVVLTCLSNMPGLYHDVLSCTVADLPPASFDLCVRVVGSPMQFDPTAVGLTVPQEQGWGSFSFEPNLVCGPQVQRTLTLLNSGPLPLQARFRIVTEHKPFTAADVSIQLGPAGEACATVLPHAIQEGSQPFSVSPGLVCIPAKGKAELKLTLEVGSQPNTVKHCLIVNAAPVGGHPHAELCPEMMPACYLNLQSVVLQPTLCTSPAHRLSFHCLCSQPLEHSSRTRTVHLANNTCSIFSFGLHTAGPFQICAVQHEAAATQAFDDNSSSSSRGPACSTEQHSPAYTLKPLESLRVSIRFVADPLDAAPVHADSSGCDGQLVLSYENGSVQEYELTAQITYPAATLSETEVDFGIVRVGSHAAHSVRLTAQTGASSQWQLRNTGQVVPMARRNSVPMARRNSLTGVLHVHPPVPNSTSTPFGFQVTRGFFETVAELRVWQQGGEQVHRRQQVPVGGWVATLSSEECFEFYSAAAAKAPLGPNPWGKRMLQWIHAQSQHSDAVRAALASTDTYSFVFTGDDLAQWYQLRNCALRAGFLGCLLYTSPSPRDRTRSRMPSSA
eukprot:TRINITY_DN17487_c0_g1_i4.p1 TRINITY_DN17487_c0_g1~~TRINITY_DN17487_c0_g1_i4.p1  ORF type:complete len:1445 (-),score=461.84 TRINITY_DN17487_c0_g1_i4:50-4384(-)